MKSGIKYLLLLLPLVSFGQNSTYLGIEIEKEYEKIILRRLQNK
mgnify:CR=1 FL=1